MASDNLSSYLNEIGRHRLLTADEEITLARKVQRWIELKGIEENERPLTPSEKREVRLGMKAKERMIVHNLRLVVNVAKKYTKLLRNNGLAFEDLIQEGTLGLDRAVELFDPTKGYKFSTYSYWWIRQGITRAIYTKDRVVRVPQHMLEKLQKATNFKRDHMQEHGYEPTIRQIAEHVEMTPQDYANLVARTNTHRSLDSLAKEDGSPLIDLLPDESEANLLMVEASKEEVFEQLQLAFFRLTDRERNVVSACYGLDGKEPKTRAELGREQSVSRESIRQLEAKGINKLKIELAKYRGQRLAA